MANSNALSPKNSTKAPGLSESSHAIKRRLYIKDFNTANLGGDVGDYKRRLESESAGRDRRQGNISLLESSDAPLQLANTGSVGVLDCGSSSKQLLADHPWRSSGYNLSRSPDESVLIVTGHESPKKDIQQSGPVNLQPVYTVSQIDPQYEGPPSHCRALFPKTGCSLSTDLDYLPSTDQPTTQVSANGFRDPRLGDIMQSLESFVTQKDQHILQLQCENNRLKMILREHGIPF